MFCLVFYFLEPSFSEKNSLIWRLGQKGRLFGGCVAPAAADNVPSFLPDSFYGFAMGCIVQFYLYFVVRYGFIDFGYCYFDTDFGLLDADFGRLDMGFGLLDMDFGLLDTDFGRLYMDYRLLDTNFGRLDIDYARLDVWFVLLY